MKIMRYKLLAIFASILTCFSFAEENNAPAKPSGKLNERIEQGLKDNKFTFVMFWNEENEQTKEMKNVINEAKTKLAEKAEILIIKIDDPQEQELITKYRINTAPMPIAITFAPNGAITGGFPQKTDLQSLEGTIVCAAEADCMKNLQEGKIVFICVQDEKTELNAEAMKGINEYINDGNQKTSHIIKVSPRDKSAKEFLMKFGILEAPAKATTFLLKPPGMIGSKFEGATTKDEIKVVACMKGCC